MSTMPESSRLFYRAEGKGPLVIMLHGLLMDGRCWVDNGFVSAYSPFFRVVCPDLIGHGASDRLDAQDFYTRENQALSVVKLMDELGYDKAHVIGYSAGAWLAMGLLDSYPERVTSIVLGGWDCLKGIPETPFGKLSFDMFMDYARETAPELTQSLSLADEKSAEFFFNELSKQFNDDGNLLTRSTPKLLWAGANDPYYVSMSEQAEKHAICFIAGKGDHLGEVNNPDMATVTKILNFSKG
ncbi:alpha/beta fold hydrolase [Raoultella terrigena]|uniref:alpha/beta fold hydrolase n=1 Tax=Raoultella terrigena TaxID=577 RepID=UPI00349F4444